MRVSIVFGGLCLSLLTGCVASEPSAFFLKSGSTGVAHNRDYLECRVTAAQQVPISNQSSTTPTYTTPVTCMPGYGGFITCTGGQTYGGNLVTTDANRDLRFQVENQCMMDKGYIMKNLKRCTDEDLDIGRVVAASAPQPKTETIQCVTDEGLFVVSLEG